MNYLDTNNLTHILNQSTPLKADNFYLQGEKLEDGGCKWSLHTKSRSSWMLMLSSYFHSRIEGGSFLKLAIATANEKEIPLLVDLQHDKNFIRFCRKLEGIETKEHKQQRLKEKFWRAVENAKLIGKGLLKDPDAKILEEFAWLEALSSDHRYGFSLLSEWRSWKADRTDLSFHEWREEKGFIGTSSDQVKYLDADERKKYQVSFLEGKLVRDHQPFTTARAHSLFSGQGIAIYVVSLEEQLYVGSHEVGKFHHSSFLSGRPIKGGGEIQTDAHGQIVYLTSKSGHYNPSKKQMLNVLKWLKKNNVNLDVIKLCVPDQGIDYLYHNAHDYLLSEGNLLPDGMNGTTFDRVSGKISIIHQHLLNVARRNICQLLERLRKQDDLDLSKVLFKEDTAWGDVFTYEAQKYLEGNMFPKHWDGGDYKQLENGEIEIRILKPRSPSEENAIEKDILILTAFMLKGVNLNRVTFIPGEGESPVNGQVYFDDKNPMYMRWCQEKLNNL